MGTDAENGTMSEQEIQAVVERAVAEVLAEEARKRRWLTVPLAAALIALLLLGGGAGLYLLQLREARKVEAARQMVAADATLRRAEKLQRQGRWNETVTLLHQALDNLSPDAPETVRSRLEQDLADAVLVSELETVRLKKAVWVEGRFDAARGDREYAEVFRRHGLGGEGDDPKEVADRLRGSAGKEALVAALDDWAFTTRDERRRTWLMEVARRVDPHPWRDRLRDPGVWRDRRKLEALAEEAKAEELSPQLAVALGWALEASRAVVLLRKVQQLHPDDFWVNFTLGTRLASEKDEEGIGALRVAVALQPQLPAAHNNLGLALANSGRMEEALACYRQAIRLDPNFAPAYLHLGNALGRKGRLDEAITCYRKALALQPELAEAKKALAAALKEKEAPSKTKKK
jgi:tetratricopeptide (TPR) repeat protein